jgi:hypothetical protein
MALTVTEIINETPVQLHQPDAMSTLYSIQLILWENGMCIGGYNASKELVLSKSYIIDDNSDATLLAILMNDALLSGLTPISHIWFAEERQMIIPEIYYSEDFATTWHQTFHFTSAQESLCQHAVVKGNAVYIVFPISNTIKDFCTQYFEEAQLCSISTLPLSQTHKPNTTVVDIIIMHHTYVLNFTHEGRLIAHKLYQHTNINDVVYAIAALSELHHIAQNKIQIKLSGVHIPQDIIDTVASFYSSAPATLTPEQSTVQLLTRLIACA